MVSDERYVMHDMLRALGYLITISSIGVPAGLRAATEDAFRRPSADHSAFVTVEPKSIQPLIAQLGNDQYLLRRHAELRLIEIGAEAFDLLQEAANHADLEIATRAKYVLHRIRIEWARPDDSAEVQLIMQRYGDLSPAERRQRIQQLAALSDDQGVGGLSRIARYDSSPILSRNAALAILRLPALSRDQSARRVAILDKEIGPSHRAAVDWIRAHFEQLPDPKSFDKGWNGLISEELKLLEEEAGQNDAEIVFGLLKYYLKHCSRADSGESTIVPLMQMVNLSLREGVSLRNALVFAISWSMDNQQWDALSQLEENFADEIKQNRLLLYFLAVASGKQGDHERAESAAEMAFTIDLDDAAQRLEIAETIAELGRHDWAEREWRRLIDLLSPTESLYARRSLATLCLHDRGEDEEAARLLAESLDAIKNDPKLKDRFKSNDGRKWLGQYEAEQAYFLACHAESLGEYQQQRKHLDAAIRSNPENPDVLIAMYRAKNADEAYRKSTIARIKKSSKKLENEIRQNPDIPHNYNHWAWLISNTEGDYEKSVAYSLRSLTVKPEDPRRLGMVARCYYDLRSLDLVPESPSCLDTLGRCYFASGDLENAIKYQRKAVERHPHLMVMRRQLDLFERDLAAKKQK